MRTIPRHLLALFAFGALVLLAPAADAQTYVRLDLGPSTQRVAPDFLGVGIAADLANNTNFAQTTFTSLGGDEFTLQINNIDQNGLTVGAIDWRDRGDSTNTGALARVGEDLIKNNTGVIRLTLGSIPAGEFSLTSYHIDSSAGQSDRIQIFVTDAFQNFALQSSEGNAGPPAGSGVGINNLTDSQIQSRAATFNFTSNGIDPIIVVFDGRISSDDETPLNGLTITQVPEPTSALMMALGGLALLARRRR